MVEKLRIYVAGPITNNPTFREDFAQGALEVARRGHNPITPIEVCQAAGLQEGREHWREFMKADIRALLECHGIYMLRDWHQSKGARIEHFIADALELLVLFQPEVMK